VQHYTDLANKVRKMYKDARVVREALEKEAAEALSAMKPEKMNEALQKSNGMWYVSDTTTKIRKLLFETAEESFVKLQVKAAAALKDEQHKIRSTIRLKDIFFERAGDMFVLDKFPGYVDSAAWAGKKIFSRDRNALADSMRRWGKSPIHYPLTKIDSFVTRSTAKTMFKTVLGWAGDKVVSQPALLVQQLIGNCLQTRDLRNEIYCQIAKQLTGNPTKDSEMRLWDLMMICLSTFRPTSELENYLEMFIRKTANPYQKYVQAMHLTVYAPDRKEPPEWEELQKILTVGQLSYARLGYSISVSDYDVRKDLKNDNKDVKEKAQLVLPPMFPPVPDPMVEAANNKVAPAAAAGSNKRASQVGQQPLRASTAARPDSPKAAARASTAAKPDSPKAAARASTAAKPDSPKAAAVAAANNKAAAGDGARRPVPKPAV